MLFALISWLRVPDGRDKCFDLLGALLVVASIAEVLGGVLSLTGIHNLVVFNLSWALEFLILLALFHAAFPGRGGMLYTLGGVFLAGWAIELWSVGANTKLVVLSIMGGAFVLAGLYLYLLWWTSNTWMAPMHRSPRFWLFLSITLYFGACTPLLGTANHFSATNKALASDLYYLLQGVCVLHYLLLGVACLKARRLALDPPHGDLT